jgi:hypothetical protein
MEQNKSIYELITDVAKQLGVPREFVKLMVYSNYGYGGQLDV